MKKNGSMINNLVFIFPVMGYYLLEAVIVGVPIALAWKFFLTNTIGHLGYLQIVVIYWIVKMLFFDVFKLIQGLAPVPPPVEEEDKNKLTEENFR
jgi:hypothetical protein